MERDFSLKETFSFIVKNGSKLICISLAVMIISTVLGVISVSRSTENIDTMEESINASGYNYLKEYINESIYFSLNAYNKPESVVIVQIDTKYEIMPDKAYQNPDVTPVVTKAVSLMGGNDDITNGIKNIIGNGSIKTPYVRELYTVTELSSNFFEIKVSYNDVNKAKEISGFILDNLLKHTNILKPEYDTNIIVNSARYVTDHVLATYQKQMLETFLKLEETITDSGATPNTNQSTNTFKILKYIIIGLLLGIALAMVYLVVLFLVNGRLNSPNSILENYPNYPILTILPGNKKRLLNRVSLTVLGYDLEPKSDAVAYDIVAANLANINGTSILMGSCSAKIISSIASELNEHLKQAIYTGGNIITDPTTLRDINDVDNVLFIEKIGHSKDINISLQVSKVEALGKNIIGFVLLP